MAENTPNVENGGDGRGTNVCLIMLCLSFQMMAFAGIALFLPVIRGELGLSFSRGGMLSAASIFVYAMMQLPSGYLGDRYGLKKLFFIGSLGTGGLCLLFGLVEAYWQALLTQMISGVFRAFLFASGVALLAGWFGPQRRATAMGLSLIGITSGQLVISALGPWLVERFTWRFPFVGFASLGILVSLAYLRYGESSSDSASKRRVNLSDVAGLFRSGFMWVCGVIQIVRLGVMSSVSFWLPSLLIDEKGLSLQATGLIIALRSLLTAPSNILGGYLSDKLKKPGLVIALSLVVLAVTTAPLVWIDNKALLILLILFNAVFIQFYFGPLFAIPVERYGAHMTGTLTGFGNFFANLGGFSFTYLLGVLKDRTGYFAPGFYAISTVCILSIILTIWLEWMREKD